MVRKMGNNWQEIFQTSNEWIISFYNSGEMDGSMLMREQSVNKYPDNLTSEYDWNN